MEYRDLVSRAKSGDDRAFEELMKTHSRAVLGVCIRLLGTGGEAEEAAQDVFLRFYKSLRQFDEARAVEPWLYRIAWNVCRDRLRRRRFQVELTEGVSTVGARGDLQLAIRELREAIDRLPDRERAALLMREIEGFDTEEVAERMGSSAVTVRSQISRARERLRIWLGGSL